MKGASMHYFQHTHPTDPLRRSVVGRFGVQHPPDRSVHRSFTRRDQLVKLGVDALTVFLSSVHLLLTCRQCHDRLCDLHAGISCRTRTQHVTPRENDWKRMLFASMTDGTGCCVKAVMRASTL